jgi:alkanesulfonate monooxygenase SsuD/methylene tetrahydromethanopterin reductase-like flavin-dependent oxidoreductase (luciferase family)
MNLELGIVSLSDRQLDPRTGRLVEAESRLSDILGYAALADTLGLDVFGLGEHHSADFAVSSPAVVLAAAAARTRTIRLTSAVTVLSVLDPVRVYQDYATLDLISGGRAELIVGRSAFTEPFGLFGVDLADYDAIFTEKLELLLRLRDEATVPDWSGRFRPPLHDAQVIPRALDLPVWVGVGGSPGSAERAGRLGLPMTLGLIGGSIDHARRTVDAYRAAGETAGHADRLRVGISTHFYAAATPAVAREVYPYYYEYLRPKRPGGRGFVVGREQFDAGTGPGMALMIGSSEEVAEKILYCREVLGIDRFFGQVDWGGLPRGRVEESIARLAGEIAPGVRDAVGTTGDGQPGTA